MVPDFAIVESFDMFYSVPDGMPRRYSSVKYMRFTFPLLHKERSCKSIAFTAPGIMEKTCLFRFDRPF